MTDLRPKVYLRGVEPFDVLFRNLFETNSSFIPVADSKINYPVDIYETKEGLYIDIAVVGLSAEDISIDVANDILEVSYNKDDAENLECCYIYRGITKKSFSFRWRISKKFQLDDKIDAKLDKGLLTLFIPITPDSKIKSIKIKSI